MYIFSKTNVHCILHHGTFMNVKSVYKFIREVDTTKWNMKSESYLPFRFFSKKVSYILMHHCTSYKRENADYVTFIQKKRNLLSSYFFVNKP